jgi:cell division inhibitor SulA
MFVTRPVRGCLGLGRVGVSGRLVIDWFLWLMTASGAGFIDKRMRAVEDLVNSVRDEESRRYLNEAVRAYQAGAFRAAVVATWIAVALDLVAKIRELAAIGEGAAVAYVARLDQAIANSNRPQLSNLEMELLDVARDQLELIDGREWQELDRLRRDRHVCAHPAFVSVDEVFAPTPELARVHIATAVDAVLSEGPTPGRKAIARFEAEIAGDAFPDTEESLADYLRARFFQHGKQSLRRNLAEVVVKFCLEPPNGDQRARNRAAASAHALATIEPDLFEQALTSVVRRREESVGLSPEQLLHFVGTLGDLRFAWSAIPESSHARIHSLIRTASKSALIEANVFSSDVPGDAAAIVAERLHELDATEFGLVIAGRPNLRFVDVAIANLQSSLNFRSAEHNMETLALPLAAVMESGHVARLLSAVRENEQVRYAAKMPNLLVRFFESTRRVRQESYEDWTALCEWLVDTADGGDPSSYYAYPELRKRVTASAN